MSGSPADGGAESVELPFPIDKLSGGLHLVSDDDGGISSCTCDCKRGAVAADKVQHNPVCMKDGCSEGLTVTV